MHDLPNRDRQISDSKVPNENFIIRKDLEGRFSDQDLINEAKSVSLIKILNHLNIHLIDKKITCPFKSHSNGAERSPSFVIYPDTNSFYCWGCKTNGSPVEFVSYFFQISKFEAAAKILELFDTDYKILLENNSNEQINILMNFSDQIHEFIQTNKNKNGISYAEKICFILDEMMIKHKSDFSNINKLNLLIQKLENLLKDYKCPEQ